ncbi:AI-2E family transporter [Bizionia paragorgiae]|jgi:predicted PurR-regulated permease PerM|uniref:AI-2E family transporter n=1 Tax=Bizionia paragorgiae TaxID=283786 RepID=UPI00299E7C92|nr:AI-2E family transporter [Bizionia paragorgiae]MDX1271975.1 AI-2E family transporter [Bizionia paragorgiae]
MDSKTISNGILKALAVIIGVTIGLWFIYKIQSVLVYIAIAGVISLLGRPIVKVLRDRFKFPNLVAVIITMILFFATILGIVSLFIPLVIEQGKNLSLLDINALQRNVESLYIEGINHFGLNSEEVQASFKDSTLMSKLNFSAIPEFLNSIISGLGSFGIGLFSVLFISFFFLKDSDMFGNSVITLFPKSKEARLRKSLSQIRNLLSRYFGGLLLQLIILFTIYSIVLLIFGIDNAIVIASLCALLNVIPYVGPIISAFLIVLLTMSSNLGEDFSTVILPKTIYVMIGFIIAQLVDNFFSQPFIFSQSVKSHPLEIFIVIVIAGLLSGVVGLIVAIPVYTAIKVVAKEFLSEYRIVKKLTRGL